MANTTSPLLPQTEELLKQFGERLRLARLRRRLQAKMVAERAGMTEVTLRRVERGLPGVTMGAYMAVMQVLQLHGEVEKWAVDDPIGRHLQDAETNGGMRPRRVKRVAPDSSAPMKLSGAKDNVAIAEPRASVEDMTEENAASATRASAGLSAVSTTDLLKVITRKRP